jgi:hypothetical protein
MGAEYPGNCNRMCIGGGDRRADHCHLISVARCQPREGLVRLRRVDWCLSRSQRSGAGQCRVNASQQRAPVLKSIRTGLQKADTVVALITRLARGSWWLPFEMALALEMRKEVVTVCESDVRPPDFAIPHLILDDAYLRTGRQRLIFVQTSGRPFCGLRDPAMCGWHNFGDMFDQLSIGAWPGDRCAASNSKDC